MNVGTWIVAFPQVHHIFLNAMLDLAVEKNHFLSAYIAWLFKMGWRWQCNITRLMHIITSWPIFTYSIIVDIAKQAVLWDLSLQSPFATWWSSSIWRSKPSLIIKLPSYMMSLPPNTTQSISHTTLGTKVSKMQFSRWPPGAILDLKVKTGSNDEGNKTNQFLGPKYPISHKLHITVGQIVENVIFKMAAGGHIGFRAPKNSTHTFARVTLAKFVI